jgi:tRNA(Arg) A34 adenosine deaminase TadA
MIIAHCEITALRRVLKQLQVEVFQQCISASSYVQMCIILMEEYFIECQRSTPFVLNGPMHFYCVLEYTWEVTVVPCYMNSTTSTIFLSQETVFWNQTVCLNFFDLCGECSLV